MIKTLKFGGTSVGSAENMRKVAKIIKTEKSRVTILSAMSGTTDALVKIGSTVDTHEKMQNIEMLHQKYTKCIVDLLCNPADLLDKMEQVLAIITTSECEKEIVAQGELLTTAIFTAYLQQSGYKAELLHAPSFMITDQNGKVDTKFLKESLAGLRDDTYYITQGFISTNIDGKIDNLGRGGSDFSAALISVAIGANEVQIWTDIDGMHNNDPRFVENTYPIRKMCFDEAAELAYFGAKILHPAAILPCRDAGVDVRLKNTMDPMAEGTLISKDEVSALNFHAVAAKDNITVVRITSARMLMAYGFLRQVFEVFEKWRTPIDMITTSEVAVSLTIDFTCNLDEIVRELSGFGAIEVEKNNTIVCIVGKIEYTQAGLASQIFKAVNNVPIKMVSYGASHRSVSLLINTSDKVRTLQSLNDFLF